MQTQPPEPEGLPDEKARTPLWKALLPWVGAVAIIAYLFWEVPLGEVWEAARQARLDWFIPLLLGAVGYWFLLDSGAYSYLITRFNAPLAWKEARAMRGVTYVVAAINWNIGTAAIVLYLRRFKDIPPLRSTSSILFYTMFDGIILLTLAFIGASFFGESAEIETVQTGAGLLLLGNGVVLAALLANVPRWKWLEKIRGWSVFQTYRKAKPRDFAVLFAIRIAYFSGFVAIFLLGARAFGITVPFVLGLASVPVIMMAGALPITPAGLGTQAAAMLYFWEGTGERAAIVAFGLVIPIALTGARVLLGLPYLKELRRLRSAED
jgi:uncharacterized membrane protein YbhN (UPF0104 family)